VEPDGGRITGFRPVHGSGIIHQTSHRVVELTQRRASERTAVSRPRLLYTGIQCLPLHVRTGRQTRCIAPRPVRCVIVHSL
jgi:hypothetical protein